MKQFESRFGAHLDRLERDSRACSMFIYTELTLHFFFSRDLEVRDRVNAHAAFWNGVLSSLQTAGFIALGRMYDHDESAHTIHALLKFMENYPGIFRPSALQARQIAIGRSQEEARSFVENAFQVRDGWLDDLRSEFEIHRAFYAECVQPIRHKFFAHSSLIDRASIDAMFGEVSVKSIENLAVFPLRLHRAIGLLFNGGYAPQLESPIVSIRDVLLNLPERGKSTWEHMHAAKAAAEMIAWIGSVMPPDESRKMGDMKLWIEEIELSRFGFRESDYS